MSVVNGVFNLSPLENINEVDKLHIGWRRSAESLG